MSRFRTSGPSSSRPVGRSLPERPPPGTARARRPPLDVPSLQAWPSLSEYPPVPAGDERRHVRHDARQLQAARIRQVVWLPNGTELLLVRAQTLEVVDRLAVLVQKRADAIPERGHRRLLEPESGAIPARTGGTPVHGPTSSRERAGPPSRPSARHGDTASGRLTAPPVPDLPDVRERLDCAPRSTTATGHRARYSSEKNPSEKPFSATALAPSQSSDTARSCSMMPGTAGASMTRKVPPSFSSRRRDWRFLEPGPPRA